MISSLDKYSKFSRSNEIKDKESFVLVDGDYNLFIVLVTAKQGIIKNADLETVYDSLIKAVEPFWGVSKRYLS